MRHRDQRLAGAAREKSDFGFWDNDGKFLVEPGTIELYAGDSSQATLTKSFNVTKKGLVAFPHVTRSY